MSTIDSKMKSGDRMSRKFGFKRPPVKPANPEPVVEPAGAAPAVDQPPLNQPSVVATVVAKELDQNKISPADTNAATSTDNLEPFPSSMTLAQAATLPVTGLGPFLVYRIEDKPNQIAIVVDAPAPSAVQEKADSLLIRLEAKDGSALIVVLAREKRREEDAAPQDAPLEQKVETILTTEGAPTQADPAATATSSVGGASDA